MNATRHWHRQFLAFQAEMRLVGLDSALASTVRALREDGLKQAKVRRVLGTFLAMANLPNVERFEVELRELRHRVPGRSFVINVWLYESAGSLTGAPRRVDIYLDGNA